MSLNLTVADAMAWFCGINMNNITASDTILDDARMVPCFSLAVPSSIGLLFVLCALVLFVDSLLFLRPRTSRSEFPPYINVLMFFLHVGQLCLCFSVFLDVNRTGLLEDDDLFSGHAIEKWLVVYGCSSAASLVLFSIVTYGGARKCELYILYGWWLINSFCYLPIPVIYCLHLQSDTPKTLGGLLFATMVIFQLPTSIPSMVSCMRGGCRATDAQHLHGRKHQTLSGSVRECSGKSMLLPNPLMHASWLSILSFSWCKPLLKRGFQDAIQPSHLWRLMYEDSARQSAEVFVRCWKRRKPWISVAMLTAFWRPFLCCGALTVASALLGFIGPWSVGKLIFIAQSPTVPWYVCIGYLSALALGKFLQAIIIQHYTFLSARVAMRLSSALKHAIYSKMLVLSPGERQKLTAGDMVNNVSIDVKTIVSSLLGLWNVLTLPLQIGLSMYLLWRQVGE
jgi:hypothetical protein